MRWVLYPRNDYTLFFVWCFSDRRLLRDICKIFKVILICALKGDATLPPALALRHLPSSEGRSICVPEPGFPDFEKYVSLLWVFQVTTYS
jgi:hypothetical protein